MCQTDVTRRGLFFRELCRSHPSLGSFLFDECNVNLTLNFDFVVHIILEFINVWKAIMHSAWMEDRKSSLYTYLDLNIRECYNPSIRITKLRFLCHLMLYYPCELIV